LGSINQLHLAEVSIRAVETRDLECLTSFLEDNNRPQITRGFHPFPLNHETSARIANGPSLDRFFVALLNEQIIGISMLRGWDEGYEIPSFGIMVDYRYQGQGIGRKLTEFAIAEAEHIGCLRVRLSVIASNIAAVHLYTSLGFNETSRERITISGLPDEKIIMFKNLGSGV
jgi:ribosomal-protein-alanine N-acetyltransferase